MSLSFEAGREPSTPKDASTVLVLRDVSDRLEIYCVQRHAKSPFLGGAIVFPGGKVDAADAALPLDLAVGAPRHSMWANGVGAAGAVQEVSLRALAVAGARELIEEAGLFPGDVSTDIAHAMQERLRAKEPLDAALRALSTALDLGRFVPFGRWVTPTAEARRFDARFFLMRATTGQTARPDEHETTVGFWASPAEILARFHAGDIQLAPPTTRCLEILREARTTDDALSLASAQSLRATCPLFVPGDPPFLALPGDPAHHERDATISGPTRFVLRDGRFVSEAPA